MKNLTHMKTPMRKNEENGRIFKKSAKRTNSFTHKS